MPLPTLPAQSQTVWFAVPGRPGKHIRVTFITEVDHGPDVVEETTTAVDGGLILEAIRNQLQPRIKPQFARPSDND